MKSGMIKCTFLTKNIYILGVALKNLLEFFKRFFLYRFEMFEWGWHFFGPGLLYKKNSPEIVFLYSFEIFQWGWTLLDQACFIRDLPENFCGHRFEIFLLQTFNFSVWILAWVRLAATHPFKHIKFFGLEPDKALSLYYLENGNCMTTIQ